MAPGRQPRVLFISADPVGREMAGLGIRYTELASVLAQHADVTVAHGGPPSGPLASGVPTVAYPVHDPAALKPLIAAADTVVTHPQWPVVTGWLGKASARVIFDLYDPETFETLELFSSRPAVVRRLMGQLTLDRLHDALRTGHHFMCASEKQRDLWIGAMLALRMIDPSAYDNDPSLRSVIDKVPFGAPADPPAPPAGRGPRQLFAQIDDDNPLVLWNGGLWSWLDPGTAIEAVAILSRRRPDVRLVFMGGSGQPAAKAATERARSLASRLGVLDSVVLFNPDWVPYSERATWLAQADCALTAQTDHLETRYAFRTRLLDCFWAGLPPVCTEGDDLADLIARRGLGATFPPGDPERGAAALADVLDRGRGAVADGLARAAAEYSWREVSRPLVSWVLEPPGTRRAGDGRGVAPRTPGHVLRALAYAAGGRRLLDRRAG